MKYKGKNFLVLGLKKSGISAIEFLIKKRANVYCYDDKEKLKNVIELSKQNVYEIKKINDDVISKMDYIIVSPGVSKYHEAVKLAILYNKKVLGELELGLKEAKGDIIAITGSNGKTTTVNLIEQAFNYAKKRNLLVGNVGNPITKFVSKRKTNYIVEVSSFQLETCKIKPKIACILNLSENHLDRHFSFKEYKETKYRIFENMGSEDLLILNYDDENLRQLESKKTVIFDKKIDIKAKILWFSRKNIIDGAYIDGDEICYKKGNKIINIAKLDEVKLIGEHNLENILCFVCVCLLKKIKVKFIREVITNFRGVGHRLEYVKSVDGVDYINDSKSTTCTSTLTAVKSFTKPIILILGGSDKGLNYDDLALKLKDKVKLSILTGEISEKLKESFIKSGNENFEVKKDFFEAINFAKSKANKGDVVLLSPATASFDEFENFEKRGEKFIEIVNSFNEGAIGIEK